VAVGGGAMVGSPVGTGKRIWSVAVARVSCSGAGHAQEAVMHSTHTPTKHSQHSFFIALILSANSESLPEMGKKASEQVCKCASEQVCK
jgi:hypothetical protein